MIWPHPLTWDYSLGHFEFNNSTNLLAIVSLAVYGGLTAWAITRFKDKNLISYGVFFFLVALFPVSNLIIKIPATFGERFLFIPSFGLIFAFIFLLHGLYKKASARFDFEKAYPLQLLILLVCVGFLTLSSARTSVWKNDDLLVNNDYDYSRSLRSSKAYIQYLTALPDNKIANHESALDVCLKALDRFGDDWQLWYFRGVIQTTLNDLDDAKYAYQESIKYKANNFFSLVNYGNLLVNEDPDRAIELYRNAIAVNPNNAAVLGNLGILLHKKGELQQAKEFYEKALRIEPGNEKIKNALNMIN